MEVRNGQFLSHVDAKELSELTEMISSANVFSLASAYPTLEARVPDFPMTYYFFKFDEKNKKISVNHSAPMVISKIESLIQLRFRVA